MVIYDVVGMGNSLLDLTYEVDEQVLKELNIKKGEMKLIDEEMNKNILEKLKKYPSIMTPGGSCSNTIAGISILGGRTGFLGIVGDDELGEIYIKKTREAGVAAKFSKHNHLSTGNALTLITPDGERSFAVYLGASTFLNEEGITDEMISNSKILHLEGYGFDSIKSKKSIIKACKITKKNKAKISLDVSDSGVIERNFLYIKNFIKEHVDIVFMNENEAKAFTGKEPDAAIKEISKLCDISIVKLGKEGSLISTKGKIIKIESFETKTVNTNGAGDMYAAGFLYCLAKNHEIEKAGNLASYAASLVVSSKGARLAKDLISVLNHYKKEIGL